MHDACDCSVWKDANAPNRICVCVWMCRIQWAIHTHKRDAKRIAANMLHATTMLEKDTRIGIIAVGVRTVSEAWDCGYSLPVRLSSTNKRATGFDIIQYSRLACVITAHTAMVMIVVRRHNSKGEFNCVLFFISYFQKLCSLILYIVHMLVVTRIFASNMHIQRKRTTRNRWVIFFPQCAMLKVALNWMCIEPGQAGPAVVFLILFIFRVQVAYFCVKCGVVIVYVCVCGTLL